MILISKMILYKKDKGVSFTEVCIALTIISISLTGLYAMVLSTIRGTAFNKNLMSATVLAQDKLERIKADAFDNITSANYPSENYNTIEDFEQFQRVVTIDATDPPGANTKRIEVIVSWRNRSGDMRNIRIGTIIAQ